ncbi:unnamed protein product [marine sediment metagenome]|uniref:Uncharacterized protein n=1 Tax=marine sediment metagenome TaxID=412755 RepID=X1N760_9ZZZZ
MRVSISPRGALKLKPDTEEEREAFKVFAAVFEIMQTALFEFYFPDKPGLVHLNLVTGPLDDLMAHSNKLKAEGCRLETDLTELTAKFGTRSGPGQAGAGR